MSEIQVRGFATASTVLCTVGDLIGLAKWCDQYGISSNVEIELDANGQVWIELADGEGDMISCGDHVPPADKYDVILLTHKHEEDKPDRPAYDWMSVDRYGDEMRPE